MKTPDSLQILKSLYAEMSELTYTDCANTCRTQFGCCSPEYCEMADEVAKREGIELQRTEHPTLPFMGIVVLEKETQETGCVVPPYLRPLCTLHHCDINDLGMHKTDPKWTKQYFKLRDRIARAEEKVGRL